MDFIFNSYLSVFYDKINQKQKLSFVEQTCSAFVCRKYFKTYPEATNLVFSASAKQKF